MVRCTKLLLASVEAAGGAAAGGGGASCSAGPPSVVVTGARVDASEEVTASADDCAAAAATVAADSLDLACSRILTDSPSCSASGMVASRKMPDPSCRAQVTWNDFAHLPLVHWTERGRGDQRQFAGSAAAPIMPSTYLLSHAAR